MSIASKMNEKYKMGEGKESKVLKDLDSIIGDLTTMTPNNDLPLEQAIEHLEQAEKLIKKAFK